MQNRGNKMKASMLWEMLLVRPGREAIHAELSGIKKKFED